MQNLKYIVAFFVLSTLCVLAQEQPLALDNQPLTGNLAVDAHSFFKYEPVEKKVLLPEQQQSKKSPALAGIMSLVIPGSGEFYTGKYLESAIFFGIDVAAITVAAVYQKKGDHKTTDFQNFADQHWDVVKYAKWLLTYNGKDTNVTWINHRYDATTANLKPWQRILDWTQINIQEDSANFSHHLELYGQQQYYELIGKYHEYNAGWDAYNYGQRDYYNNTPGIVYYYETIRNDANSFYNINSKALAVIYLNHALSAINAIWDAILYNKNIKLESTLETKVNPGVTEYIPTLKMRWYF